MATEGQDRATTRVAATVKAMLLEMLANGEIGPGCEVAVKVLSPYELKPVKRVETEGSTVKVRQGHSALETIG